MVAYTSITYHEITLQQASTNSFFLQCLLLLCTLVPDWLGRLEMGLEWLDTGVAISGLMFAAVLSGVVFAAPSQPQGEAFKGVVLDT